MKTKNLYLPLAIFSLSLFAACNKETTNEVDEENKEGFFLVYKRVVNRLIEIIQEVNPNYKYAKSLASSVVEGALHQQYIKKHFKTITNFNETDDVTLFYIELVKKTLS